MRPFKMPTMATTGSIAKIHTCKGRPKTSFKMKVKRPPLAMVAKKPVIKGRSFHSPMPAANIALTKMQQVVAPANSLATLPKGKADLEEGTNVRPAIKPIPIAWVRRGRVRLITMEYIAIVQLGVTPPTLGLTVCKIMPIAKSIAVIATQR